MKRALVFLLLIFFIPTIFAAEFTLHPTQTKLLTDGKLNVFLCGTGDPEIDMQMLRHPACVAVFGDNQFFLIDAGEGAIQTAGMLGLPVSKLDKVFMTHWHSDHFGGLGQVINGTWIAGRETPMIIYGPSGVIPIVNALKQAYQLDAKFRVKHRKGLLKKSLAFGVPKQINTTKKGKQVYKKGDITVSAFKVDHDPVIPAFGYRIQYKGCKLVISGDTKVVKSLAENAKDADALINEVFSHYYYEKTKKSLAKKSNDPKMSLQYLNATHSHHSDSIQLAKMAQKYGVKRLFLTHFVPAIGVTWSDKHTFMRGMKKYYKGPITLTDDRDQIELSYKNGRCYVKYIPARQFPLRTYHIKSPSKK